ncbi:LPXTG cell wall anchor domain-containing protein [Streptococcus pluranimalium]|uniref:LPXTG cell wall anchor domain-containing protein n=1 Tax=Streptococcus pluranimalium TaxID=82348 RepID=UPI0039FC1098
MTKQHLSKRITLLSALALASVSLATTDLHTVHADEAVASTAETTQTGTDSSSSPSQFTRAASPVLAAAASRFQNVISTTSLSPNLITTLEQAEKKTITDKPEYTITTTVGTDPFDEIRLTKDDSGNAVVSPDYHYFENAGDNYPALITNPNYTERFSISMRTIPARFNVAGYSIDMTIEPFNEFDKHLIVDPDKAKSYVNDPSTQTTEQIVYYKPRTQKSLRFRTFDVEDIRAQFPYPVTETWYYGNPPASVLFDTRLREDGTIKNFLYYDGRNSDEKKQPIFEFLDKKSGDTTATNLEQYANKYRFVDYAIDHHDKKIIAKVIYFAKDKKVSASTAVTNPAVPTPPPTVPTPKPVEPSTAATTPSPTPAPPVVTNPTVSTPQPTVPAPQPENDKAVKKELTDPKTGIKVTLGAGETIDAAGLKIQHVEPSSASVPQALRHLDFDLFDIKVVDKEAKDLDITKPATVTIPADAGKTVAEVIYLPNDTQKVSLAFSEKTMTIDGRQQKVVVFEAPHFSQYALVYKTKATSNTTRPTVTSTTATKPVKSVASINQPKQPNQVTQTASVTSSLKADKPEVTLGNQKAAAKAEQTYQAPTALGQTDVSKAKTLPNTGSHTGLAMSLMGSFLIGAAAMVIKRQKN